MPKALPRIEREQVVRLWLARQGLAAPRGRRLTRAQFLAHLDSCGALQLDSVNALARAHLLTLWSRYGHFDPATLDRWVYEEKLAYEFWGHEASLLPLSSLPLSRRYMRDWAPRGQWWEDRRAGEAIQRRVLRRIRAEGPLESAHFEAAPDEATGPWWGWKDAKMALEWLWRRGRLAVRERRHFRRVYDLAERVYPPGPTASRRAHAESWALIGLGANGVATARHLDHYLSAPRLTAPERAAVLDALLRAKRIVAVTVPGLKETAYALPETLDRLSEAPVPRGTTLICPFDSLLWQRRRAEELLDFRYRVEIYTPPAKRSFGYYVLPILHEGRLVGRLDPRLDRAQGRLTIHAIGLEPGVTREARLDAGLAGSLAELARFVGATELALPAGWRDLPV